MVRRPTKNTAAARKQQANHRKPFTPSLQPSPWPKSNSLSLSLPRDDSPPHLTSPRNSWSCTKRSPSPSASPPPAKPGETTPTAPGPRSGGPPRNSISRHPAKVKLPARSTAGGIPPAAPLAPLPPRCGAPVEAVELVPAAPPGEARSRRSSKSLTARPVARVPDWSSAAAATGGGGGGGGAGVGHEGDDHAGVRQWNCMRTYGVWSIRKFYAVGDKN